MPISKSAKKSLRNAQAKKERNLLTKTKLKESIKKINEKNFSQVMSLIDKATKKNIIHKNKASRLKAQLTKKIHPKKITKRATLKKTQTNKKSAKKIIRKKK